MAELTPYKRGFSFTNYQEDVPDQPLPGTRVDIELDNIAGMSKALTDYVQALNIVDVDAEAIQIVAAEILKVVFVADNMPEIREANEYGPDISRAVDLFLGAFTDDPSTGHGGDPLVLGATYYNLEIGESRVWNGSDWVPVAQVSVGGVLQGTITAAAGTETYYIGDFVNIDVSLNGARLRPGIDYTTASPYITIPGLTAGDQIGYFGMRKGSIEDASTMVQRNFITTAGQSTYSVDSAGLALNLTQTNHILFGGSPFGPLTQYVDYNIVDGNVVLAYAPRANELYHLLSLPRFTNSEAQVILQEYKDAVAADADRAERARDEAEALVDNVGADTRFYNTIALGRAAVANGDSFGVIAGGSDGLTRATIYRRDSASTQTVIGQVTKLGEIDIIQEDIHRTGSPEMVNFVGSNNVRFMSVDAFGHAYMPHLGGMSVQDSINRARYEAEQPAKADMVVSVVKLPGYLRMTDEAKSVYAMIDEFGGLQLAGLAGRSVQDKIISIEAALKARINNLQASASMVVNAVHDLGFDPTGSEAVDNNGRIMTIMADMQSNPKKYGFNPVIYWPRGDFRINDMILAASNISHIGSGMQTRFLPYSYNAAFRHNGNGDNFLRNSHYSNFLIEGENQIVRPPEIGPGYWARIKGFFFSHWQDCVINNVQCQNTGATSFGNDHADRCWINDCRAENGGRLATVGTFGASGFGIGTGRLLREEILVTNCIAVGNKNYGAFVERQPNTPYDSQGAIFLGLISRGNNYGFGEAGCDGTILSTSELRGNLSAGVAFHGGTVTLAHPGTRTMLTGNQILENLGPGIKWDSTARSGPRGYISVGNRIEGNTGAGHQFQGNVAETVDDLVIRDDIYGNGSYGIDLQQGNLTNFDVIGARMINNGVGAIRLNANIRGGRISGVTMRDLRDVDATQLQSIVGSGNLTDFDISEVQGVGCAPMALTGTQTRVTYGRNPGL